MNTSSQQPRETIRNTLFITTSGKATSRQIEMFRIGPSLGHVLTNLSNKQLRRLTVSLCSLFSVKLESSSMMLVALCVWFRRSVTTLKRTMSSTQNVWFLNRSLSLYWSSCFVPSPLSMYSLPGVGSRLLRDEDRNEALTILPVKVPALTSSNTTVPCGSSVISMPTCLSWGKTKQRGKLYIHI